MKKNAIGILLIFTFYFQSLSQIDSLSVPDGQDIIKFKPMGKIHFSAKPKSMWELGLHTGHFLLEGDVDPLQPSGYGIGLHLRKSIRYVFSIRADLIYGEAKGLDPQFTSKEIAALDLNETSASGKHDAVYRNYKLKDFIFSVETVVNIGNILFHKESTKWNWYALIGLGMDMNTTTIDVLNGNKPYDFSSVTGQVNTREGRKSIKKQVKSILDGSYETEARQKVAIFRLGDKRNIHALLTTGVGLSRKLSKRINLGIEHQVISSDNDLLDGFVYRSNLDQSNNSDIIHYTSLRLGMNVGNLNKRVEPMYWLNPLDGYLNDIANLKMNPVLDLTDTDGDGVIDMLDQEKNSPAGVEVDTKGITLDSDVDGIPNFMDKEPYSLPGHNVDSFGVAKTIEEKGITGAEVNNKIDESLAKISRDWFFPMIHFASKRFDIPKAYYPELHYVARVMASNPEIRISVTGHTDSRNTNQYNNVLAFKRAEEAIGYLVDKYNISRDRFALKYSGKDVPLVQALPNYYKKGNFKDLKNELNRRVEFKVVADDEKDMSAPDGPAIVNEKGNKSISTFKGFVNKGY